jgi:hypothetical protein
MLKKICILHCVFYYLLSASLLYAKEVDYPVACYQGEKLQNLRDWEKTWSGKKIGPDTIGKVKEFIPESLYQIITNPSSWGEIWFEIVPYKQIKPTACDLSFTIKYAGACKVDDDDKLTNYVCGIPFPNPETGLEIAYNFDNRNQGDSAHSLQDIYMIDGKNRYDKKMVFESHFIYYAGRREIPPTPEITPNPKNIFRATHGSTLEPASLKGSRSVRLTFIDRSIDSVHWSFSSNTRKITRLSTAQKAATQGGSDTTSDDQNIYDSAIEYMTYKYLGRKELLLARHQDIDQLKKGHREGYCLSNGFQRERINTYVLECTHKNPGYLYSKQIWYIDPETWWILYSEKYDRQGKLWRVFENANRLIESVYNGAQVPNIGFVSIVDVKAMHSTAGFGNYTIGETGMFYKPDYYTPKALQKYGY